jgi:hypothetical protein
MSNRQSVSAMVIQRPLAGCAGILALWMCLHALDALLTHHLLGVGGTEGNPLLAMLQGPLGDVGMLWAKLTGAAAVGIVVARTQRPAVLRAANGVMALVVLYKAALVAYVHWPAGFGFP